MRKQAFIATLLFIFVFSGVGNLYAQKEKKKCKKDTKTVEAAEPTAKEALNLILSNGDIPLTVDESCKSVGSSPNDKTILDYVSGLMSFQTEPNSKNRIEFTFKQKKDDNRLFWVNDLMFLGENGEDIWSYGVRFTMRNSDRKMLRKSVICIGAG